MSFFCATCCLFSGELRASIKEAGIDYDEEEVSKLMTRFTTADGKIRFHDWYVSNPHLFQRDFMNALSARHACCCRKSICSHKYIPPSPPLPCSSTKKYVHLMLFLISLCARAGFRLCCWCPAATASRSASHRSTTSMVRTLRLNAWQCAVRFHCVR